MHNDAILKYYIYGIRESWTCSYKLCGNYFYIIFYTIVVTCDKNLWQTIYGFFRSWWMSLFNIKSKRLQLCQSRLKGVSRNQVLLFTNVTFHTKQKKNAVLAELLFKMEDMPAKLFIS